MPEGIVMWIDEKKRFGFIKNSDGVYLFVHSSSILMGNFKDLYEGQHVSFDIQTGPKGQIASNLKGMSSIASTTSETALTSHHSRKRLRRRKIESWTANV